MDVINLISMENDIVSNNMTYLKESERGRIGYDAPKCFGKMNTVAIDVLVHIFQIIIEQTFVSQFSNENLWNKIEFGFLSTICKFREKTWKKNERFERNLYLQKKNANGLNDTFFVHSSD